MARQYPVPLVGFINETGARQYPAPGGFLNETSSGGAQTFTQSLSATLTRSASITETALHGCALAASLPRSASMVRRVSKVLTASLPRSAACVRVVSKPISVSLPRSAALGHGAAFSRSMAASLPRSAALIPGTLHRQALAAALTRAAVLSATFQHIAANVLPVIVRAFVGVGITI